jgi:hypothetical protein
MVKIAAMPKMQAPTIVTPVSTHVVAVAITPSTVHYVLLGAEFKPDDPTATKRRVKDASALAEKDPTVNNSRWCRKRVTDGMCLVLYRHWHVSDNCTMGEPLAAIACSCPDFRFRGLYSGDRVHGLSSLNGCKHMLAVTNNDNPPH